MATYNPPRFLFRRHSLLSKIKRGSNFLEVGAGNLKMSNELTKFFDNGTSIDFAPGVKKLYKDLPVSVKKKLTVHIGDFLKYKFDHKFDCIVSCEVLEHVEQDKEFLLHMHKLLNNSGQLLISVPAKEKYWTIHDDVVGHLRRYEKQQLINLLDDVGFKNIQVYSYGYPFINILWRMRAVHGRKQAIRKAGWSKKKQTQESGIGQIPTKYNIIGFLVNKYTFFIPNIISSFFENFDLSEGYIAVATKK